MTTYTVTSADPVHMGQAIDKLIALTPRTFSTERRESLASKGKALPGGGFPIPDVDALKRAIQAIGRAKDPEKTKAFIKKRARELGREDLIPENW